MPKAPQPDSETPKFEESLADLERIVAELEAGDVPLERALALFEKGTGLGEKCRKQLEAAETKVEVLLKKSGRIEAQLFPDADE